MHKENSMKKYALVGAAALLLSLGLFGCNNTAEGVSKDASTDGQKMASATKDAADATKIATDKAGDATKQAAVDVAAATKDAADATGKAAKDAADATGKAAKDAADATGKAAKDAGKTATGALEVTPKVKLAILADKDLNDTHNLINVNTKDGVVHLEGHVASESRKKKAGMIATKTLKDMNATDTVSNELTVTAP